MSYKALYRKLRPDFFKNIIGQDHIVRTLKNEMERNKINHAYLFCGTRGTGKTSTAKVFAKAINCKEPINGEACNNCTSCNAINDGSSLDIIEIDAASNNGVDNIREIKEDITYTPTFGKHKVYIIDEVHMLSTGAFNALLKTLEEPPEHIVFILATTDPQKLPATILSRCQRFDFKRISTDIMINTLKEYMTNEKTNVSDDALSYIAYLSDGAMRDALSLLDQCMSFYFDEDITRDKIITLIGATDKSNLFNLLDGLILRNSKDCINIINEIVNDGRDIQQFLDEFVVHLRNILVVKSTSSNNTMDYSDELFNMLLEQSKTIEFDIIFEYINIFSSLSSEIKYVKNKKIKFETACLRICNLNEENSIAGILTKISKLEEDIKKRPIEKIVEISNKPVPEEKKIIIEKALPKDIEEVINNWNDILSEILKTPENWIIPGKIGYVNNNIINIIFDCYSDVNHEILNKQMNFLKELLTKKYEKEFNLKACSQQDYDSQHKENYGDTDHNLQRQSEEFEKLLKLNDIETEIIS